MQSAKVLAAWHRQVDGFAGYVTEALASHDTVRVELFLLPDGRVGGARFIGRQPKQDPGLDKQEFGTLD